jgi:hypothetical protein
MYKEIDLTNPRPNLLTAELIIALYATQGVKAYITPKMDKLIIGDAKVVETKVETPEEVVTETVHKGGRPKGS